MFQGRRFIACPIGSDGKVENLGEYLAASALKGRKFPLVYRLLFSGTYAHRKLKALSSSLFAGQLHRGIDVVSSPIAGDNGQLWTEVTKAIEEKINQKIGRHAIYYPSQTDRSRIYLYLYNLAGKQNIFVKIEYGRTTEALENELSFITYNKRRRFNFDVPTIIGQIIDENYRILLYNALPAGFSVRNVAWENEPFCFRNQFIGVIATRLIDDLPWWQSLVRREDALAKRTREIVRTKINPWQAVGMGHGDFTNNNIFYRKTTVVIVDWEAASMDAPFMLDEISYRLGQKQKLAYREPWRVLSYLCSAASVNFRASLIRQRLDSTLLSLAYLVLRGNYEAGLVADEIKNADCYRIHGV